MIKGKNFSLSLDEGFGIAHVGAQIRGHFLLVVKQRRENRPIALNDWVVRIEYVEGGRAVVSINDHLHAVANVIDVLIGRAIVTGIWIVRAFGKRIDYPEESSF